MYGTHSMKLIDQLSQISDLNSQFYQKEFNYNFWLSKYFQPGLRVNDAWPAVCAVHDIWSPPVIENVSAQIDYIKQHRQRIPKIALDVGSGEGAISCFLAELGCTVISIDCNPATYHYHRAISRDFFGHLPGDNLTVYHSDLSTAARQLSTVDIDTVLLINGGHRPGETDNRKNFIQQWHEWINASIDQFRKNQTHISITGPKNFWSTNLDSVVEDQFTNYNTVVPAFKNHTVITVTQLPDTPTRAHIKYIS